MANFNLNKVILGGRLTADPELKQTPQSWCYVEWESEKALEERRKEDEGK